MRILPSELNGTDYVIAGVIGLGVFGLLTVWGFPGLDPDVWAAASTAARLNPPEYPMPGLWRALVGALYSVLDAGTVARILRFAGHAAGGLIAMFGYILINETMPMVLRQRMRAVPWSRRLVRLALALVSVCLACSDPVWRVSQTFSPDTFAFLLSLFGFYLCIRFLQTGRLGIAYAQMLIFGLMSADSPTGFVFAGVAGWLTFLVALDARDELLNELANPVVRALLFRRMTGFFLLGLVVGVAVNMGFFVWSGGSVAQDWHGIDIFTNYFYCYWLSVVNAASWVGWFFIAVIAAAPLLIAYLTVGRATDDDTILPYRYGLLFIALGTLAFLQLAGWRSFWFWNWIESPVMVRSRYALSLCSLMSAITLAYAFGVLLVEVYFRNNRRIIDRRFPDAVEDPVGREVVETIASTNSWRRALAGLALLALLLAVLPYRQMRTERRMLSLIESYITEAAREGLAAHGSEKGAKVTFTDGGLDAGVELRAHELGGRLIALPMVSLRAQENDRYRQAVRCRAAADDEDRELLETDSASALRTWVSEKTNRLEGVSLQLGFELWKHLGRRLPQPSGLLAYALPIEPAEARRGVTAAHALAADLLAVYDEPKPLRGVHRTAGDLFTYMQFRLSNMAKFRAEIFDRDRDATNALLETRLAERLDEKNDAYQRIRRQMNWIKSQRGSRFSPREGLKLGLERADFLMARSFAQQVLRADPDDSQANFAMGMSYFMEEQYARAEAYLTRILKKRPKDIAVLNNLAVIAIRLGRIDAALEYSERAIKLAPKLADVRKTRQAALELDARRKEQRKP